MRDDRRAPPPPGGDWDRRDDGWGGPPPMRDSRDHWGPPPPRGPPGGGWDRRDGWGAPPPRGARDDYGPPPGYYDDRYDSRGPPPPRDYYDDRDRGYYRSPPRGPPPRDYYDDRRDSWGGRGGYDPRGPPPDRDGPPPRDDGRPYVIDTNGNNGLIVGPKGSNVRRIETETGARVNCVSDKTTVEVTGHPEAVRRAVDMIRDILAERSDRGDDLRSRLGGKRGRDDDRRDDRDKRPRIDSLLEHLRTQAKEAGLSLDFQLESIDEPADENGDVTKSIGIENYIGLVIGRQGRMQSEIQSVTGIPMDINRDDNTASFKGPADKVAQGIALVREVIETTIALRDAKRDSAPAVRDSAPQYERKTGPREGDVEDTVDISGFVGAVLGKGGAQVKYIKSQVRCHLTVNREKEIVELRGPPKKVELAVKLINQTIERTKERNSKKEQRESVEEAEPQAAAEDDDNDEIEEGSIHEEETA
jgi:rRNA processing protein Krr1/Pno1